MAQAPALSIRIGGAVYKVHASASPDQIERLARLVDERLSQLNPQNRPVTPQMFLLVALSFAHELEAERSEKREGEASLERKVESLSAELERERSRRAALEAETRDLLRRVVARIDHALEDVDEPLTPAPPASGPDEGREGHEGHDGDEGHDRSPAETDGP